MITILDCYTDEPAGLGVPPFLGTYPRYIAGELETPYYLTIDDLRLLKKYSSTIPETKEHQKTDISVYNLTKNYRETDKILKNTDELIIIIGVHTPGKYLTATPGTLSEVRRLLEGYKCRKVLAGPITHGSQLHGGKFSEFIDTNFFHEVRQFDFSYDRIKETAVQGARILEQIPDRRMIEIETGCGCSRKTGCSFCLEPIKNRLQFRDKEDIIAEIKEFHRRGARRFRLGKQSCIYAYPDLIGLLKEIREIGEIDVLHIDNANPANIVRDKGQEKTKAIIKYCTEGNIAAFGVESFDPEVIRKNNLNSDPETTMQAIRILNEHGRHRGPNGMPHFLPGINILLGLIGENRKTLELNYEALKEIIDNDLLLRRINIRKVVPFKGTPLEETTGNKFLRKNKRHYFSWRRRIREDIDHIMLQKLVPKNSILKDVIAETYDGKHTFCRQMGTYPLIVGVRERLPLKEPYDLKVTGHMLRSLVAEPA